MQHMAIDARGTASQMQKVRFAALMVIKLGMHHAGARAHALHFTGNNAGSVAHRVFVRQRALQHIAHDFHIAVAVLAKARAGSNAVLVDGVQRPELRVLGIVVFGKRKAVRALQSAGVGRGMQ